MIKPAAFGTVVPAVRLAPLVRPTAPAPATRLTPRSGPADAWYSGFCGSTGTTCQDASKRCKGFVRNGALAARPIITCACSCHPQSPAQAG